MQVHRNKSRGLDIAKRMMLMNAIPVYPEEKSGRDISRETGLSVTSMLSSLSIQVMICEDGGRYSWLDQASKDDAIRTICR